MAAPPKHFHATRVMMRNSYLPSTLLRVGRSLEPRIGRHETVNTIAEANAARDRRDWAAAALHYSKAVEEHPLQVALLVQLGHSYKELGDFDAALEAYRQFLGHEPNDFDIHLQLGHLFNRMNESEVALEWYARAEYLAPDNTDAVRHASETRTRVSRLAVERKRQEVLDLVRAQRWRQAREGLRELVADGETDLIGIYANVTKEAGDFDEALKLYENYRDHAEASDPGSLIDVEIQLGHLHKAMRDIRSALQHYIRAREIEFELKGYVGSDSVCEREIRACMAEIYTCFWNGD